MAHSGNIPPGQEAYANEFGWTSGQGGDEGYSFDMSGVEFGTEQQFGSFDYNSAGGSQPATSFEKSQFLAPQVSPYRGTLMTPDPNAANYGNESSGFEDEPPLLEELGINFDHIVQKTLAVLNPLKSTNADIMQDTDLAGPLVFCLAFGGFLLLSGKVQFGYIYGIGVLGCLAMYSLLNLMSVGGVSVGCIISVLGYCLLPMVGLSGASIILSLKGMLGSILTLLTVVWCSGSASKLFVTALAMDHQQLLVAYPCALLYGVFALLTVF